MREEMKLLREVKKSETTRQQREGMLCEMDVLVYSSVLLSI